MISPAVASSWKWWSSALDSANVVTARHSCQPSPDRHVEDHVLAGHHRCLLELEALAGHAFGHPDHLVGDDLGVDGFGGAARREARQRGDPRRRRVRRLTLARGEHAGAHPSGPDRIDDRDLVRARDVDHDVAGPVEPARRVTFDVAPTPVVARPRLPHQRRVDRVDADALDLTVEPQASRHSAARPRTIPRTARRRPAARRRSRRTSAPPARAAS